MAKTKSNEMHVRALCEKYGVTNKTLNNRFKKAGIDPVRINGNYRYYRITPQLEDLLNRNEHDIERLRKMKADADLKELQVQEKSGELVSVKEIKNDLINIFANLHKRIALQIPPKITKRMRAAKTEAQARKLLEQEVGKVFDELRTNHSNFI